MAASCFLNGRVFTKAGQPQGSEFQFLVLDLRDLGVFTPPGRGWAVSSILLKWKGLLIFQEFRLGCSWGISGFFGVLLIRRR